MQFREFENLVYSNDAKTAAALVRSLYSGTAFILKGAFEAVWLRELKENTFLWGSTQRSDYHKMIDNCPDFRRFIGAEETKKYSMLHIKESHYFFPWNDDPLDIFSSVNKRWRVFKFLGGYEKTIYENNLPSDGIVDRLQIVRYPSGGGCLESHTDPLENQKVIIGAMMSQRGTDYSNGGFYFLDMKNNYVDCEPHLEVGDMVTAFPTLIHGVAPVDPHIPLEERSNQGRWFLGLYSNDSNYVPKRSTASSLGHKYPSPDLPLGQ